MREAFTLADKANDGAVHVARALLVYTNPFPLSVATLMHIAQRLVTSGTIVDAIDAYAGIASRSPFVTVRDRFYELLSAKYRRFILPSINGVDLSHRIGPFPSPPPLPTTVACLRAATAHGAQVGLAALSTAASFTQLAARDGTSEYGWPLASAWDVAHRAALAATKVPSGYDAVYIFNGRHAESRPFCDNLAATCEIVCFEAGALPNSFVLSPAPLHDPNNIARRMAAHPVNAAAGVRYFEARRARRPGTDAHRFTDSQTRGLVPDVHRNASVVSMFTSSEDEFFAISDRATFGAFEHQFDAATSVAQICKQLNKTLMIRLHPHLGLKSESWRRDWDFDQLRALGATVIMPDEPVDSYALVDLSESVITCGSTIGIEAAFSYRPSLMIGEHFATALGICTGAWGNEDLLQFLRQPAALVHAREQAIIAGSYFQTSGTTIPGLTDGSRPASARLYDRIVDPARWGLSLLRT